MSGRTVVIIVLCSMGFFPAVSHAADEQALLTEVSRAELERHATEIVKYVRPSGSPGELAAHDYVAKTLRSEAIPVDVYEFPGYVSDPVRASLGSVGGDEKEWKALTQSFSASTGPEGLVADVVDCGRGTPEELERARVEGKIALIDGPIGPDEVKALGESGAAGGIYASSSERINEMTVSPVWGTPTQEDYRNLPSIPTVAVNRESGAELRERLAAGGLKVRMVTEVDTGWKKLRVTVATIRSAKDPEGFVLVGGHMDAWHYGATDEGTSNAAMVELARIFYRHRDELERGLKVAWWTGHSNGRYAGSTWYADTFWTELRDDALAYLNLDVIGQVGAKVYSAACTPELDGIAKSVMRDVVDVDGTTRRPGRNSDESFYGIGIPLLQFYHDRTEEDGGYWFWHTPEDTFDKIDFDNLAAETRLYVAALHRLLTSPVPPLDPTAATGELKRRLDELAGLGVAADLPWRDVLDRADRLHNLALSLQQRIPEGSESLGAPEIARRLVRFIRPITRVIYEESGPYHPDPALEVVKLPGLTPPLRAMKDLDPESDLYRFTHNYVVRELNRLRDHLDQALEEGERLAGALTLETS